MIFFLLAMVSNVLNYGFQLAMGRILNVEEYGTLNVLVSIMLIVSVPAMAFSLVVARYTAKGASESEDAVNLAVSFFGRLTLAVVGAVFVFGLVVAVPVASYIKVSNWFLVAGTMTAVALSYFGPFFCGVMQGLKRFTIMGIFYNIFPAVKLVFGCAAVYAGYGLAGIVGAFIVGQTVFAVLGFYTLRNRPIFKAWNSSYINTSEAFRYALTASLISILIAMLANMDMILIKHYFSAYDAGLYGSSALIGKVILYVPSALVMIMFPFVAEINGDPERVASLLRRSLLACFILASATAALFNIFPDLTIRLLFGEKYLKAAKYILPVSVLVIFISLLNMLMSFVLARGRTRVMELSLAAGCFLAVVLTLFFHSSVTVVVIIIAAMAVLIMAINIYAIFVRGYGLR